jgi:hypothetical protein
MEVLGLVQVLWRRRIALGIGLIAAAAAAFVIGSSPPTSYGVGWARVVLDTPDSQVVDTSPPGAETLPMRASLLVHLMTTEESKQALARRLGVPADKLAVIDPALSAPQQTASLPSAAAKLAGVTKADYVLTVYRSTDILPMISLEGAAPDTARAKRLVQEAAAFVKDQGHPERLVRAPVGPDGKPEDLPIDQASLQGFEIEDVTPVRAKNVVSGGGPMIAIMAALAVLGLWTAAVVTIPWLLRQARRGRLASPGPEDRALAAR